MKMLVVELVGDLGKWRVHNIKARNGDNSLRR
jgi:hypothetical protein